MTPMSRDERRRRAAAPFALDFGLDQQELVESLCWPGRAPGRWLDDAGDRVADVDLDGARSTGRQRSLSPLPTVP